MSNLTEAAAAIALGIGFTAGFSGAIDFDSITEGTRAVAMDYTNKTWDTCDAVQKAAASFSDFPCEDENGNSRPSDDYLDEIGTPEWVKKTLGTEVSE
jgi:hypothetical protein